MGEELFDEPGATPEALADLRAAIPQLPAEYFEFLARRNGGEAPIPIDPWTCVLWAAEEVADFNHDTPDEFIAFGSNGGGTTLAFRKDPPELGSVWAFDSIGGGEDRRRVAGSFRELIEMTGTRPGQ